METDHAPNPIPETPTHDESGVASAAICSPCLLVIRDRDSSTTPSLFLKDDLGAAQEHRRRIEQMVGRHSIDAPFEMKIYHLVEANTN